MKRTPLLLLTLVLASCASSGTRTPTSERDTAPVQGERRAVLLHINDVYRIEGVEDGQVGGLARLRTLRKEMESRRAPGVPDAPTHASRVREKYGDAEPRQPRPNPNRGDNLTGTSPYQDTDPSLIANLPLVA